MNKETLRKELVSSLESIGYTIQDNRLKLDIDLSNKEAIKKIHEQSLQERFEQFNDFISSHFEFVRRNTYFDKIDARKVDVQLIPLESDTTFYSILAKFFNYTWWSLPYEPSLGRQLKYLVYDKYHKSTMGLIILTSPVLDMKARDDFLKLSGKKAGIINMSMSAQRLGAVPPYNDFLCGKLIAMLSTSNQVREDYRRKYDEDLLFTTTTGGFGKASIYQRLKFHDEQVAKFVGYTAGCGTFHIPNNIYSKIKQLLREEGHEVDQFSNKNRKMLLLSKAGKILNIKDISRHGIKRSVYVFSLCKNLQDIIHAETISNVKPEYYNRSVKEIYDFFLNRWAVKRLDDNYMFENNKADQFFETIRDRIQAFKKRSDQLSLF